MAITLFGLGKVRGGGLGILRKLHPLCWVYRRWIESKIALKKACCHACRLKRGKINQNTYQGAVKRYLSCNSTTWGSLLACCRPVLMDLPCREMSETRSTSLQNRCTHNRTHMNISLFASVIFNISPIPGVWEWLPQLHAQWQICSVLLASSPTNWTNP